MTQTSEIIDRMEKSWHLDRKFALSLIVTILVQTGGIIWWASKKDSQIEVLYQTTAQQSIDIRANRDNNIRIMERLATIEANQKNQTDTLNDIKSSLRDLAKEK